MKWYGKIGFSETKETEPGVWETAISEREYYGDLIRNSRSLQTSDKINDDINISNEISIVADPYAIQNFYTMKYAEFMGAKWKINNINVQYPRLILGLGGLYNEQSSETSE